MSKEVDLPADLINAYNSTDYSFTDGDKTVVIRLDEENHNLISYLKEHNISTWAYLTAWNPLSQQQTKKYNQSQQQLLFEKLKDYRVLTGEGKSRNESWPGEESFFVADISREEAKAIGKDFGQNAIIISKSNLEPELAILYPAVNYNS